MTHTQPTVVPTTESGARRLELLVALFRVGCTYGRHAYGYGELVNFGRHWPEVKGLLTKYQEDHDYKLSVFDGLIDGVWVL
jgi:hypothetical protein